MGRRTPLFALHATAGARIVDFAGWDMPLSYGSQIEEHHAVRRDAGMFDASHMGIIDVHGTDAQRLLARLVANDVGRLAAPGRALYGCMLDEQAGIIDDLIVYRLAEPASYRVVVNAGTRDGDLEWMRHHARGLEVDLRERADLALLAIQGPVARERFAKLLPPDEAREALALKPFCGAALASGFVARTGYTGEDGFEVMVPGTESGALWQRLLGAGVSPCGLAARDTLRLEAGLNLYGSDMDRSTHPLESALGWTVAFEPRERAFIGREALERVRARGVERKLTGLLLEDRGVLRSHQPVTSAAGEGHTTSGTFSPTLQRSIALARVPAGAEGAVGVEVRGKLLTARIVQPPFVRRGRPLIPLKGSTS
jgi:aminomethyltransferase